MFQFPGFALITLCIQVISTCFSKPLIACANNDELSGGFPHSEIPGSKLILSSPGLIAEYHVLHRLLLPRHPPNALIALDLIRKKKDRGLSLLRLLRLAGVASDQKHVRFPLPHHCGNLVSVLDLDSAAVGLATTAPPLGYGRQRR